MPHLEAYRLMRSQSDRYAKIGADKFDEPGVLCVIQTEATEFGWHLQREQAHVPQLLQS